MYGGTNLNLGLELERCALPPPDDCDNSDITKPYTIIESRLQIKENTKYVEMNVGLYENNKTEDWSEDSEPDSPGSPPERDNAYTSDSDSSSSDSVSTTSSTSSAKTTEKSSNQLKLPQENGCSSKNKKPMIQEMD